MHSIPNTRCAGIHRQRICNRSHTEVAGTLRSKPCRQTIQLHAERLPEIAKPHLQPFTGRSGAGVLRCSAKRDKADQQEQMTFPARSSEGPVWTGDYRAGDVLGGKYTVLEVMGRGSNGVTYKAEGQDGKTVAVKALSLRGMTDWKQLELFEREAQTLETLQHPGIPRYIDYLSEDTEKDRGFFLVQELAEGRSLAQLVQEGWRADEAEVTRIGIQLLETLDYLGSRRPPVIHRDVKAENVVLEGGRSGGRIFLVDFGGVQAAAAGDALAMGSTVIGTYGYMAPEQFRGAALPASDLYGLGGTLLFLLSGKPPSAFPQDRLRLDFRSSLQVGDALGAVLEGLLEPLVEDRMSASDALKILKGETSPAAMSRSGGDPPGARSRVAVRGSTLEIDIPRGQLLSADRFGTASFALVWNGTTAVWTLSALAVGSVLGAAFSLPFWFAGYQVAKDAFGGAFSSENLSIGVKSWRLKRGKADDPGKQKGRTADLKGAKVTVTGYVNGEPRTQLELLEGFRRVPFGLGLGSEEQLWLAEQINDHIERLTGRRPPPQEPPRALRRPQMTSVTVGGPTAGSPGVFGGRVWGGPSSLDSSSIFWDDDSSFLADSTDGEVLIEFRDDDRSGSDHRDCAAEDAASSAV